MARWQPRRQAPPVHAAAATATRRQRPARRQRRQGQERAPWAAWWWGSTVARPRDRSPAIATAVSYPDPCGSSVNCGAAPPTGFMWRNCSNIVTDLPARESADIPGLAGRRGSFPRPLAKDEAAAGGPTAGAKKFLPRRPASPPGASSQIGGVRRRSAHAARAAQVVGGADPARWQEAVPG